MPKIKSLKDTLKRLAKGAAQSAAKVTKGISKHTEHSKQKMENDTKLLANSLTHISSKNKDEMLELLKNGPTIKKYFKVGENEKNTFKRGSVTGIMIGQLYDYLKKPCDTDENMLKTIDEKPQWLRCTTAESIKKELKKALPVNWTKSVLYDKKVLEALAKISKKIGELESEMGKQYLAQTKSKSKVTEDIQGLPTSPKHNPPKRPRKSNSQSNANSSTNRIILSNNRHSLPPTTNQIIDTVRSYANAIYEKMLKLNADEKLKAMFEKIKNKLNDTPNDKIKFSGNEKLSLDVSFQKLIEFRDALSHTLDQLEKSGENNLTQNIENDVKIINTYLGLDNTSPLTQNQSKSSTNTKTPKAETTHTPSNAAPRSKSSSENNQLKPERIKAIIENIKSIIQNKKFKDKIKNDIINGNIELLKKMMLNLKNDPNNQLSKDLSTCENKCKQAQKPYEVNEAICFILNKFHSLDKRKIKHFGSGRRLPEPQLKNNTKPNEAKKQYQTNNAANTKTPDNSKAKINKNNESDIFEELIEDINQKPADNTEINVDGKKIPVNNIDDFLDDILKTL